MQSFEIMKDVFCTLNLPLVLMLSLVTNWRLENDVLGLVRLKLRISTIINFCKIFVRIVVGLLSKHETQNLKYSYLKNSNCHKIET
jgi:hypothetical protein